MPERGCIFCRIVAGELPAAKVWEDDETLGFLDTAPLQLGHVLLVPKKHIETLADLPEERLPNFFRIGQRLSVAVVEALEAEGSFVAINNVVSQSVPHLHLHVVPRRKGDGLKGFFWPRHRYATGEVEVVTEKIRAAMKATTQD